MYSYRRGLLPCPIGCRMNVNYEPLLRLCDTTSSQSNMSSASAKNNSKFELVKVKERSFYLLGQTHSAASRNFAWLIELVQCRWTTPLLRCVRRSRAPLQANEMPKADRGCQLQALRYRAPSFQVPGTPLIYRASMDLPHLHRVDPMTVPSATAKAQ